jgi:hypothetical protein
VFELRCIDVRDLHDDADQDRDCQERLFQVSECDMFVSLRVSIGETESMILHRDVQVEK